MDIFKNANELFAKNRYLESKHLFHKVMRDVNQPVEFIEESFNKAVLISSIENSRQEKVELLLECGDMFYGRNMYRKSFEYTRRAFQDLKFNKIVRYRKTIYERLISLSFLLGEIQLGTGYIKEFLNYCIERKLVEEILNILDQQELPYDEDDEIRYARIFCYIVKNDSGKLENALESLLLRFGHECKTKELLRQQRIFKTIAECMHKEGMAEKTPGIYNAILLKRYIDNAYIEKQILGYGRTINNQLYSVIVKTVIETIVLKPSKQMLATLVKFYELSEENKYIDKLPQVYKTASRKNISPTAALIPQMKKVSNPRKGDHKFEMYDFVHDENELINTSFKEKQRALRDLSKKFLSAKRLNQHGLMAKLKDEMLKLDPENRMAIGSIEKGIADNSTHGYTSKMIVDSLIKEIEQVSFAGEKSRSEVKNISGREMQGISIWEKELIFKYQNETICKKNYKDLIVMFNMLGFYEVTMIIIEKIKSNLKDLTDAELLEVLHFEVVTFVQTESYSEALHILKYIDEMFELELDAKLCFVYLRAEILFKQGRYKEAYSFYLLAYRINKKYRLVEDRIKLLSSFK